MPLLTYSASRFNPSTGLMLISTARPYPGNGGQVLFQSLDWVDVDFDRVERVTPMRLLRSFNPSTGLMLISTSRVTPMGTVKSAFQSLDWVDVDFDA